MTQLATHVHQKAPKYAEGNIAAHCTRRTLFQTSKN